MFSKQVNLGPFVIIFSLVTITNIDYLSCNGNSSVHQAAVTVIEEIRQLDAVSIFKFQSLVALLILLRPNGKGECSVFGFCLTKHPFVEKKIVITGGRHYKSERTTPWT